jgi:hypothetical protein
MAAFAGSPPASLSDSWTTVTTFHPTPGMFLTLGLSNLRKFLGVVPITNLYRTTEESEIVHGPLRSSFSTSLERAYTDGPLIDKVVEPAAIQSFFGRAVDGVYRLE